MRLRMTATRVWRLVWRGATSGGKGKIMPKRSKLTLRLVSSLKAKNVDYFVWDSEVIGFGLKVNAGGRRVYVLQYRHEGRSRRYVIGAHGSPWTPETARVEATRLLGSVASDVDVQAEKQEKRLDLTVAELCDLYVERGLATKKQGSIDAARSDFNNHVKPRLGSRKAASIARADVEKLLVDVANGATGRTAKSGKKRGLSRVRGGKGAANSVIATLSAAFSYGIANGVRADNPVTGVAKFAERKLERFLSAEELIRVGEVLKAADTIGVENMYATVAIRLLIMTGCRRNEILTLKRSYLDVANKCLRLPDSKTGAKVVHIGDTVVALLRSVPEVVGNPYFLPGPGGAGHIVNLQKVWVRIRKAARVEDVRIHDLRHSFASFGANTGDSLLVIGALLGHRSHKSTERYAHLAAHPVKAAAQRISGEIGQLLGAAAISEGEAADLTEVPEEDLSPVASILGEVIKAKWLDTQAASARCGLTVSTLQTYRWMGIGPPFHKIGKRVVYSQQLLDRWKASPAAKRLADAA